MRQKGSPLPSFEDRLPLGNTGLRVSPFCLGSVADPDAVLAAYDAGINFFFVTADLHWPYYEELRQGLLRLLARGGDIRDRIVVAGATYTMPAYFIEAALHEALRALPGLDHFDVHIVGGSYSADFLPRLHGSRWLRDELKMIRGCGSTFHDRRVAMDAYNGELLDIGFIRYSPFHPGARTELFPKLRDDSRVLLYNFKSVLSLFDDAVWQRVGLGDRYWRPRPTDFYRFALSSPCVDGILGSLRTIAEVNALQAALTEGPLDDEEQEYLIDLSALANGDATLDAAPASSASSSQS